MFTTPTVKGGGEDIIAYMHELSKVTYGLHTIDFNASMFN